MRDFYGRPVYNEFPIQDKCKRLTHYLRDYIEIANAEEYFKKMSHPKANEKAKIILRYYFDSTNKEFERDYSRIKDDIGNNTFSFFIEYTNSIMKIIGKIAECVVVDTCNNNKFTNQKCINIALLKKDILYNYPEINYEKYSAFSTSYKFFFDTNEDNMLVAHKNFYYNPNDTSMDISWCEKDNELATLMVGIDKMNYCRAAHLQVKASTNLPHLPIQKYLVSPIIVFDFRGNIEILKEKYPRHIIFSARDINTQMHEELEFYYRQILAYVAGISDKLEITDEEYVTNTKLQFLFQLPFEQLIETKKLGVDIENIEGLVKQKQIRIEVPC